MSYISPQNVTAPKERWTLHRVIMKGTAGEPAYALGSWDKGRCIATRWNGTSKNETGWPRVFTHPFWHILGKELNEAVLASLSKDERIRAKRYLDGKND